MGSGGCSGPSHRILIRKVSSGQADIGAVAALANLFVNYLATFLPWTLNTWARALLMAILIAIPAVANYLGVCSGTNLSNVTTVAKLSPLVLLILFGVARYAQQPQMIHVSESASSGTVQLGERNGVPAVRVFRMGGRTHPHGRNQRAYWLCMAIFPLFLRDCILGFTHPRLPSCSTHLRDGCWHSAALSFGSSRSVPARQSSTMPQRVPP